MRPSVDGGSLKVDSEAGDPAPRRMTMHGLRHSLLTLLATEGVDLAALRTRVRGVEGHRLPVRRRGRAGPGGTNTHPVADVAASRADLVVVPSVERLGFGRQVFERVAQVRAAGGDVAGPGVRIDSDGRVVVTATAEQMSERFTRRSVTG